MCQDNFKRVTSVIFPYSATQPQQKYLFNQGNSWDDRRITGLFVVPQDSSNQGTDINGSTLMPLEAMRKGILVLLKDNTEELLQIPLSALFTKDGCCAPYKLDRELFKCIDMNNSYIKFATTITGVGSIAGTTLPVYFEYEYKY